MFEILYLFIFILGTCVGSFLNCLIYRLEQNEKGFFKGRSFCPKCRHQLVWQDLIPILSFLYLGGKCRYCKQKISLQDPLGELITGFLFVLIFHLTVNSEQLTLFNLFNFCYLLTVICFLIIIFIYDLKHYIIPDKIIYPAIGITFLYKLFGVLNFGHWNLFGIWNLEFGILRPILSAILASGFFLSIVLISKGRWMGIGDIKLAFFMGLFLGFPKILVALFLAFLIGAIIGMGLVILDKKTLKSEVPFGPFLVMGTFLALFWGNQIINWYLILLTINN